MQQYRIYIRLRLQGMSTKGCINEIVSWLKEVGHLPSNNFLPMLFDHYEIVDENTKFEVVSEAARRVKRKFRVENLTDSKRLYDCAYYFDDPSSFCV